MWRGSSPIEKFGERTWDVRRCPGALVLVNLGDGAMLLPRRRDQSAWFSMGAAYGSFGACSARRRRCSWGTVPCPVHQGKRGVEAPAVDGDAPGVGEGNLREAGEDVAGRHLDEQACSELEEQGRGVVPANRAFDASSKVV